MHVWLAACGQPKPPHRIEKKYLQPEVPRSCYPGSWPLRWGRWGIGWGLSSFRLFWCLWGKFDNCESWARWAPFYLIFSAIIAHLFLIIGPKSVYKIGFPASSIEQSLGLSHHFLLRFSSTDAVRNVSKAGCVKMQTRTGGGSQKIKRKMHDL